jgi:hypothetical protein
MAPSRRALRWTVFLLALLPFGCDRRPAEDASPKEASCRTGALADKPIAPFQKDLLEVAFRAAMAIPVEPHLRTRCRTQEEVVATCLQLDQPKRAIGYLEQIKDWRRGAAYADLAFYCVQHGLTDDVQTYLDLAARIAEAAGPDWARDRVRVKIARTYALLEQKEQAERFEAGVPESETGKVAAVRAQYGEESFEEQMEGLERLLGSQQFDIIRNALESSVALFDRFYGDAERRPQVEEAIRASWEKMPLLVRIDLVMRLGECAAKHGDGTKALELFNEAQAWLEGEEWPLRFRIPLTARVAEGRFRAGDAPKARADADAALALFDAEKEQMVDIDRATALHPLAEAYQAMGDPAAALGVYKRAVEEGVVNVNSRPRAEDLSATCCSMALHAVEPDAELWTRIRQIGKGLGPPW